MLIPAELSHLLSQPILPPPVIRAAFLLLISPSPPHHAALHSIYCASLPSASGNPGNKSCYFKTADHLEEINCINIPNSQAHLWEGAIRELGLGIKEAAIVVFLQATQVMGHIKICKIYIFLYFNSMDWKQKVILNGCGQTQAFISIILPLPSTLSRMKSNPKSRYSCPH